MLGTLRRYRLPAVLALFSLVLGAFGPLVPCEMEMDAQQPVSVETSSMPCHEATAPDGSMDHRMPAQAPDGTDDAPCVLDDCCSMQTATSPRVEALPERTPISALVLATALSVLVPTVATDPVLLVPDGSPPPAVSLSVLYGCFLI